MRHHDCSGQRICHICMEAAAAKLAEKNRVREPIDELTHLLCYAEEAFRREGFWVAASVPMPNDSQRLAWLRIDGGAVFGLHVVCLSPTQIAKAGAAARAAACHVLQNLHDKLKADRLDIANAIDAALPVARSFVAGLGGQVDVSTAAWAARAGYTAGQS